jgi:prevent-host-death family protein
MIAGANLKYPNKATIHNTAPWMGRKLKLKKTRALETPRAFLRRMKSVEAAFRNSTTQLADMLPSGHFHQTLSICLGDRREQHIDNLEYSIACLSHDHIIDFEGAALSELEFQPLFLDSQYSHDSFRRRKMNTPKKPSAPIHGGDNIWKLANAKARLSEVVDRAKSEPQMITRNGRPSAVIVSAEEWSRKTSRKGTLADFLMASPLRNVELDLDRQHDDPRDITL